MEEKSKNTLFPVFLKLENLKLTIIGGGVIALEKINAVLMNSPSTSVKLVAENISDDIYQLIKDFGNVTVIQKRYEASDLNYSDLIISAVGDPILSEAISKDAKALGILLNSADKPDLCDFYLGSIVHKGYVKIAISTNGKSPTLAKRLRESFETSFPDEINDSLENLTKIRGYLKGDFTQKVKQLNVITSTLSAHPEKIKKASVSKKRIWIYSLSIPLLLVLGYSAAYFLPPSILGTYINASFGAIEASIFLYILAGFTAQMIDGALGMAYGITSTTFLLSFGISPAASSASVHASEIFTSGVSGFMHLKFGNVNAKLFRNLLIPGVLGAILGAYILSSFQAYGAFIKPVVSIYTLILGLIIIFKALQKDNIRKKIKRLFPLAAIGGFLDSIGGGGWGPIVSSTLIAKGRHPKYTIGSVNLAEFFITVASSFTFISIIGITHWPIVLGLIIGGVIAAPIAAYIANKIPVKSLMIFVGIVVIVTSLQRIFF
jgi:uncharacterized protein